jgi:aspartate/methionine/tyrosine aminotransferase
MFSKRTNWVLAPNRLSELVAAAPQPPIDLTESNPTRVGLDDMGVVELLGDPRGRAYRPDPRGVPEARAAVARYYGERGVTVDVDRVLLSASTSEAYSWSFKLLCDPGDTVLVPAPAYPLLSYLADLEEVRLAPYPLLREEGWRIDTGRLASALDEHRARAIVIVHPGNPTGTFTRREDAASVAQIARAHDAALIVDEVFADYPHGRLADDRLPTFAAGTDALTLVMSGLSKVALAPGLKLGWLLVTGADESSRATAVERLEVIADSYLSVSTPVQLALPEILARAPALRDRVRERVMHNLAALDRTIAERGPDCPLSRLPLDGGWYALIELPRTRSDDDWLAATLAVGVLVHPGYFFDMPEAGTMVVSLLPEPTTFAVGIQRAIELWSRG